MRSRGVVRCALVGREERGIGSVPIRHAGANQVSVEALERDLATVGRPRHVEDAVEIPPDPVLAPTPVPVRLNHVSIVNVVAPSPGAAPSGE